MKQTISELDPIKLDKFVKKYGDFVQYKTFEEMRQAQPWYKKFAIDYLRTEGPNYPDCVFFPHEVPPGSPYTISCHSTVFKAFCEVTMPTKQYGLHGILVDLGCERIGKEEDSYGNYLYLGSKLTFDLDGHPEDGILNMTIHGDPQAANQLGEEVRAYFEQLRVLVREYVEEVCSAKGAMSIDLPRAV